MINRLIKRVKYIIENDSSLLDNAGAKTIQEVKEVDDLDGYLDSIKKFPAVGISRNNGEYISFQGDNRGLRDVKATLGIRVYTKSESSPEAARMVLDIMAWKVAQVFLKNPTMYLAVFDTESNFLKDSDVTRIVYGSSKLDKVYYEYATILLDTNRDVFDPVPDETYYDVLTTMLHASFTGENVVVTETT